MKVKKVLISQPQPTTGKSPYFDLAEKYGVEFVFKPFIRVDPLSAKEFRQQHVNILDHTAVVFTSRHAVDHFFQLCAEMRVNIPEDMKYFCITETVSLYIQKYVQYRKRKVFFGNTGKVDSLMAPILKHNKIAHTEAIMYRTVSNEFAAGELDDFDMLVFFSPAGIESLKQNAPDFVQGEKIIGCFGGTTAKAIRDAGLRLDIEAPVPGITSMSAAIDAWFAANQKK